MRLAEVLGQMRPDLEEGAGAAVFEKVVGLEGALCLLFGRTFVILGNLVGVAAEGGRYLVPGFNEQVLGELALGVVELLDVGLELCEHLVVALGDGSGDDEGGTGVVYEHGVDFVDDGVVVLVALHEVLGHERHVVAQVVEAELVVGAEGDVAVVGGAALLAVGLGLVDAGDSEAVELVERTHPLGVALGQVVVDGDDVDAFACEGVEEDGEGGHECLALAGSHLGDVVGDLVALEDAVEHLAADELDVVVNHVPLGEVAAGHPFVFVDGHVAVYGDEVLAVGGELSVGVGGGDLDGVVLLEAAGGLLDDGEDFREGTVGCRHYMSNFSSRRESISFHSGSRLS